MKQLFITCSSKFRNDVFMAELIRELNRNEFAVPAFSASYLDSEMSLIDAIRKSGFVLAIVVGNDPNVFFEVGIAMGARKPVLLVSTSSVTLPFDLRSVNCIMTETMTEETIIRVIEHLRVQRFDEAASQGSGGTFGEVLQWFHTDPARFETVDSQEFCRCVREWCVNKGMHVEDTEIPKDAGYDFWLRDYESNRRTLVDVRKHSSSSKVSVVHVRALLGVIYAEGADHGVLVSASDFTRSAYEFAERCEPKVELWTMENLLST